jgi:hypothetical protein
MLSSPTCVAHAAAHDDSSTAQRSCQSGLPSHLRVNRVCTILRHRAAGPRGQNPTCGHTKETERQVMLCIQSWTCIAGPPNNLKAGLHLG